MPHPRRDTPCFPPQNINSVNTNLTGLAHTGSGPVGGAGPSGGVLEGRGIFHAADYRRLSFRGSSGYRSCSVLCQTAPGGGAADPPSAGHQVHPCGLVYHSIPDPVFFPQSVHPDLVSDGSAGAVFRGSGRDPCHGQSDAGDGTVVPDSHAPADPLCVSAPGAALFSGGLRLRFGPMLEVGNRCRGHRYAHRLHR